MGRDLATVALVLASAMLESSGNRFRNQIRCKAHRSAAWRANAARSPAPRRPPVASLRRCSNPKWCVPAFPTGVPPGQSRSPVRGPALDRVRMGRYGRRRHRSELHAQESLLYWHSGYANVNSGKRAVPSTTPRPEGGRRGGATRIIVSIRFTGGVSAWIASSFVSCQVRRPTRSAALRPPNWLRASVAAEIPPRASFSMPVKTRSAASIAASKPTRTMRTVLSLSI